MNKHSQKHEIRGESGQLQCQTDDKYVVSDVALIPLPVSGRSNTASGSLSKEAQHIARDKDPAQPAWRDAKEDLILSRRKTRPHEMGQEQVDRGADKDGRDDDVREGHGVQWNRGWGLGRHDANRVPGRRQEGRDEEWYGVPVLVRLTAGPADRELGVPEYEKAVQDREDDGGRLGRIVGVDVFFRG